jgi:hypothetical protein
MTAMDEKAAPATGCARAGRAPAQLPRRGQRRHLRHDPGALAGEPGVPTSTVSFHAEDLLHAALLTQVRDGRQLLIHRPSIVPMNDVLADLSAHSCQAVTCDARPVSAGTACTTC